jgi:hypothetical protein
MKQLGFDLNFALAAIAVVVDDAAFSSDYGAITIMFNGTSLTDDRGLAEM